MRLPLVLRAPAQAASETGDDPSRVVRLAGLALPAAVWVLGVVPGPAQGLTPAYLLTYTAVLAGMVAVDQTAPPRAAPLWRRLFWVAGELALAFLLVRVQGTMIRPALIYLLPASRCLQMFGERLGLLASLSVWVAYGVNVALGTWPDKLLEFTNYYSFFLAPYALAVVLTTATLRQGAARQRVQGLYDELSDAHARLQAMHRQVREAAVAEERNRLAREIHDSVAHYLTVINLQLEAAEKLAPGRAADALDQVRRARRLTVECLQEVRRSVRALRAATIEDLALPAALRRLVEEFGASTGLDTRFYSTVPEGARLPPEVVLALYRVAQEGLTNVQRHAGARSAVVRLSRGADRLLLAVEDDGRGPAAAGASDGGFGLPGLRERLALLGGSVDFGPRSGAGSRLLAMVPAGGGRA